MIGGIGDIGVSVSRTGIQISDSKPQFFVAKITAVGVSGSGSGSGCGVPHAWIEQHIPSNGCDYEDHPQGRYGTTSLNPGYALGGGTATVGQLVLMWERGITARDTGTVYDFMMNGGAASSGSGSGSGGSGSAVTCLPYVESFRCVNGQPMATTKYLRISGSVTVTSSDTACTSGSG